jgi:hypothetical protein
MNLVALLPILMIPILATTIRFYFNRRGVIKYGLCLVKIYMVLFHIFPVFIFVPFKFHFQSSG